MPDDQQTSGAPAPSASGGLTIPEDVTTTFGPLIELIKGSESMNNEERQYWINILPIMTEEQIKNLGGILENERKQLAAIDAKYHQELTELGEQKALEHMGQERRDRREQRLSKEEEDAEQEHPREEEILRKIHEL